MVSGTGIESTSGLNGMPGMLPVTTQDYLYHMQIPPGSPVYVRSPSPFTTNHSWNPSCRPPSRLSGMQCETLFCMSEISYKLHLATSLAAEHIGLFGLLACMSLRRYELTNGSRTCYFPPTGSSHRLHAQQALW